MKKIKKVNRGVTVGNDQFQNLADFELSSGIREKDFPVFISRPIIPQAEALRVVHGRTGPVMIEGFQAGIDGEKLPAAGADHRGEERQCGGNFSNFRGSWEDPILMYSVSIRVYEPAWRSVTSGTRQSISEVPVPLPVNISAGNLLA